MEREYKILSKNSFFFKDYRIIPIRDKDKYLIMEWRNNQIYHLRQKKPLLKDDQDNYFKLIIAPLFDQREPNQILFSFLKKNELIGYGGLVHLNWDKKEAEISFLIDTKLQDQYFEKLWYIFLNLIEEVAFDNLELNKIYTYSFDLRPKLYKVLKKQSFLYEGLIKNAIKKNRKWVYALIHSKFREKLTYREACFSDSKFLYEWSNELITRKNSLNKEPIKWEDHNKWFNLKLANKKECKIFIFLQKHPIGVLRLDKISEGFKISFSVDKNYRGKGLGFRMVNQIINEFSELNFYAEVIGENENSNRIFIKNGFKILKNSKSKYVTYQKLKHE